MELHQFRTDGEKDITELSLGDVEGAKRTALDLVSDPQTSGVYRIQFRDAQYDRTCWDTYHLAAAPLVGAVVFAGIA